MMEHYLNGQRVYLYRFADYEDTAILAHPESMTEQQLIERLLAQPLPCSAGNGRSVLEALLRAAGFIEVESTARVFLPTHWDPQNTLTALRYRLAELKSDRPL